jgi:glycosyltransferase involved in cell wall biosynthesis
VLLVEQTIEYLGYLSYARSSKFWFLKPLFYIDIFKLRWWEEHFWRTCSRLVVMSAEDKNYLEKTAQGIRKIDVVENGVDMEYFKETKKKLPKDPTVLFVGTFKWLPNVEAVRFLIQKVWPAIRERLSNAKLHIVGSSPTNEIFSLATQGEGITVSGRVEDIREAYASAHVLLAPIFSGKGTRYKVLEALATGTPVIATPLAVEGLAIDGGTHALIADSTEELANDTVRALQDATLRDRLAKNGMDLVFKEYNWKNISAKLDRIYSEVGNLV